MNPHFSTTGWAIHHDFVRRDAHPVVHEAKPRAAVAGDGLDDPAVHFPAGAVPKDGPSAGITMTTALMSLLLGRPVRGDVAMTGEVTLQGRVLPIGGVKQKVLAAHAAGITDVIIPERNRGDLDDVPENVMDDVTFHPVMSIAEVLGLALEEQSVQSSVSV